MKTQKIKILVSGGGLNYKGEVDSFTAAKVVALCMEVIGRIDKVFNDTTMLKTSGLTKESPAEYLKRHFPHNNFEKELTLAGYIAEHQSRDWFTMNEILGLFRDAGESTPANISRDFQIIKRRGWIHKDNVSKDPKRKGSYYITPTGKAALARDFPVKK